ncbi:hypothetical protein QYE76_044741 [Lolium multiflorum]|uniref:Uncharacterized protein n=1 Tax=Lolium multiflorum TaxID=4521 RepID=A0AAD8TL71_LOLMU|nr:hypothetical protein QYE76_044741 [Lolium multiflorum]
MTLPCLPCPRSTSLSLFAHRFVPSTYPLRTPRRQTLHVLPHGLLLRGDLHWVLRKRLRGRLPVAALRFYAAEVLLALKPEKVLLRGDGHIVLSVLLRSVRWNSTN